VFGQDNCPYGAPALCTAWRADPSRVSTDGYGQAASSIGDQPPTSAGALSVVIPVWGRYVPLLAPLVSQLRAGQRLPLTIVVVDNASDVPLPFITGVRVLHSPRRVSTGAARNLGLAVVDTDLVVFTDADDRLAPGALDQLAARVSADPEAVGAVAAMSAYHPAHDLVVPMALPSAAALAFQHDPVRLGTAMIVKNGLPVVGPAVWRTRVVRAAGGFADLSYAEDWALGVALAFRGPVLAASTQLMLVQFHHGSQITCHGRPAEMLATLAHLHLRWYRDPAIPALVKVAMPLLAIPRLLIITKRAATRQVSHGATLDRLGNPTLAVPPEP